ncbi:hypothetical protein D9611_000076 [Ephemerocybe angulata]|uniref:G-protein coupled receptors family 1 profile domain-containing protein n=1 Tax=Ephemerocybe angulata TaxID=980116 RepID=A0A8H5BLV8_9AGAR|nr:hypothetical protein D9611_000076 [Tulosesus angulatus]
MAANSDSAFLVAAYMRISSLAIALYDYLETAPTAYKFYKEHWEHRRFSISVLLFILIRFISILTLTISNAGFFYSKFTIETCGRFYLLPPIFKVLQAMVSQAILGVRAFNLSRRSKRVGWVLLGVYFAATVLQWVTTLYQRSPLLDRLPHVSALKVVLSFLLISSINGRESAWIFYAISMIYDIGITAISIFYLLKFKLVMKNTVMAKVTRMMMYDGLGYLLVLTGTNVLNLVLYKATSEVQTAGSSLGYCVSWIMSQRLLVHLYDASRERQEGSYAEAVTLSQNIGTARDVSRVVRAQFDRKHGVPFDYSRPTFEVEPSNPATQQVVFPEDVGVQVRVERTVRRNRHNRGYELEDYTSRRSRNEISSRHIADVGAAVWTFVMAANTFTHLFLELDPKRYAMWIVLSGGWIFTGIIVGAGTAVANADKTRGPFYNVNGVGCWISPEYEVQLVTLGYMIMLSSALLSTILYVMTFLRLRGNIVGNGWKLSFRRVGNSGDKYFSNNRTMLVAKQMLLFPLAYSILIFPLAITRFIAWSGKAVPFELTIFSVSIYMLSGFVNVFLFTTTRRILPLSSMRIGNWYLVPSSRPTMDSDEGDDSFRRSEDRAEKGVSKMVTFISEPTTIHTPPGRKESRRPPELNLSNNRDSFASMYSDREGVWIPPISSHWSVDTPPLQKSSRMSVYLQNIATAAAKI